MSPVSYTHLDVYKRQGYDCVTNHLRCFEGREIERDDRITGMYIARKYEEYITKVE